MTTNSTPDISTTIIPTSIQEEINDAEQSYPQIHLQSKTTSFVSGSYERTIYTRVKFTLTFPDNYPDHALIVDIASDNVVPPGLKKKLEKELTQDLPIGTYQQVSFCFQKLVQFVNYNKFLPCWKELKQCINLIQKKEESHDNNGKNNNGNNGHPTTSSLQQQNQSMISIIESKAKIKLKLVNNQYYYQCTIMIDDNYPTTSSTNLQSYGQPCVLSSISTNLPSKIEKMISSQGKELVRRMQDGMNQDDALRFSNPIKDPRGIDHLHGSNKKNEVRVRLTHDKLKGLKEDIETLSRVRDLREVDSAVMQGNGTMKANNARDRKDARRTIKKITVEEQVKDLNIEEQEKQWQKEEEARMAGYNISEYDGSNPQPSLLPLVMFLRDKIKRLPMELCPSCKTRVLPSDPKELEMLYMSASECKTDKEKKTRRAAKARRPMRTYCGHWWHHSCLNKYMVEPPFGLSCPAPNCERRVYHPDWPDDIKQLERSWAGEQARLREIADAAMFL